MELRDSKGKEALAKGAFNEKLGYAKTAIPLLSTQAIGSLLSVESE
jgi:hypothetical protein